MADVELISAGDVPFVLGLHELGRGTWAYLQPDGLMGLSNAGLVVGGGASLLVDTLFDLRLTGDLLTAVAPLVSDNPLHIAVNTHSNGDHTFGNQLLPDDAVVWASAETAGFTTASSQPRACRIRDKVWDEPASTQAVGGIGMPFASRSRR